MYLLLLGVVPNLTLARPPQQDNSAMMMIFCGRELVAVIDEVCSASKSYSVLDPLIANQSPSDVDSTQGFHFLFAKRQPINYNLSVTISSTY